MSPLRVNNQQEAMKYVKGAAMLQLTIDGEAEEVGAPEKKSKRDNPEERTQIALFAKRRVLVGKYPDLRYLHSTLNGIFIPPALIRQVADAGLTKGVLDIRLDVPHVDPLTHEVWHGLAIDLKDYDGRPTPEQLDWAQQLWKCRIRAYFCGGDKRKELTPLQDAWYTVAAYLQIAGADNRQAELTRAQELQLAEMVAQENLSKQQKRAQQEANRLAKALQPPPVPSTRAKKAGKAV